MKINDKNLTLKYRAKTFYFASVFLPRKVKKDIENLYIFCRYLDDLGDDLNLSKVESFKKLRIIKDQIKKKNSTFPAVRNFINIMIKHKINKSVPIELIKGIEYDLRGKVNVKTSEQLIKYCYQVAGTVGFMFCKIINVSDQKMILGGIQLGIAMQLTNISRDVAEDLKMNRIYIPKSMRSFRENDKEKILSNKNIKIRISKDLLLLLKLADLFYENAWSSIYILKKKYGIPISIAAELYRRIGKKIACKKGNIWRERIYVNFYEKVLFSFKAVYKLYFSKNVSFKKKVESKVILMLKKLNVKFN
jgi:phytoene synthase